MRDGPGGRLRGHFRRWDWLNGDPLSGGDIVGVKPVAGVVQAFHQAPDKPPFYRVAGLRPAPLEVKGVVFDDVATFPGVVNLIELGQQLLSVGSQELPRACQLFESFLDQVDNVGVP